MRSFVLTEDAAREIVKAGTPKKYRSTQIVRKPTLVETPQKPEEEIKVPEIFLATVAASWTQNGARNAEISITYYDRTAGATVAAVALSPLSRENDLFAEGTQILVVKTVDGAIYLLNAECPQ